MLEEMKLKDVITLISAIEGDKKKNQDDMWKVGNAYFIRTVTMHLIGKLERVTDKELLLSKAVWVADSGRFNNALLTGVLSEVEPFVEDVIVNRGSVIDATVWTHKIPDQVK